MGATITGYRPGSAIVDKLMYILNDETQNYPFFRLQLVFETFGHLT